MRMIESLGSEIAGVETALPAEPDLGTIEARLARIEQRLVDLSASR
jgi:hypothetical protein